jgi:OOP family OmpA-OmpF porin
VKTALIVVSDGKEPLDDPAGSAAKLKAENPDACFYAVLVGDDPGGKALMDNIAQTGECGYAVAAESVYTTEGMTEFVNDVFLSKKPPPPPKIVEPTPRPCPDSDNDGVCDENDRCPRTPVGVKPDAYGCWVLGGVLFDFDKAVIKEEAYPLLDEVHRILMKNPDLTVVFEGHTDSVGPEVYNQNLSERRAGAVMKYMLNKGVPSAQMSTAGYGETRPAADNGTKQGRALNRRVEITPKQYQKPAGTKRGDRRRDRLAGS